MDVLSSNTAPPDTSIGKEVSAGKGAAALHRSKEVGDRGEAAALHVLKEDRRSPRLEDASVDSGHLQIGVDLLGHPNQLTVALQIQDTFTKALVSHRLVSEDDTIDRR